MLAKYERLVVKSRIKECESAIDSLSRRLKVEGRRFDQDRPELYSLQSLNDLAGVRVLTFPRGYVLQATQALRERFPNWASDPVKGYGEGDNLADKYYGYCDASSNVRAEVQIVPMLTGLFWEVEHGAYYKPSPRLADLTPTMKYRVENVLTALDAFEEEFERLIRLADQNDR